MCTIIGKFFPDIGWVGLKNRDRSYKTKTDLNRDEINGIQRVTLSDEETLWCEGMNSYGVSILSSSLTVEIHTENLHHSKNGARIKEALEEKTVKDAIKSLKTNKVTGCVMVFDKNEMWLIEGQTGTHKQVIHKINKNTIARTNHGIWIPEAGYPKYTNNPILGMRRLSSESRLLIANYITKVAKDENDMMVLLANTWTENNQLNTIRKPDPPIYSRTTEQLMIIPDKKIMLVRSIDGELEFDQKTANPPNSSILVGII